MRLCFLLEPLEPRLTLSAGFLAAHGVPGGAVFLDLGNDVSLPRFFFQPDGKFLATDNLPDYGPDCPGGWKEYEGKRFFARFNPDGSVSTINVADVLSPGTLAIVIPNVSLSDAQQLVLRMEGDQSGGIFSVVRFTPSGNAPVTVFYHVAIHGC